MAALPMSEYVMTKVPSFAKVDRSPWQLHLANRRKEIR